MAKTLEQHIEEVTEEVELQKPMMITINGEQQEMTDADYEWHIQVNAQARYDEEVNGYKYARQSEYPAIEDQLDEIFHTGLDGWKETIQAVKDKYPKPE